MRYFDFRRMENIKSSSSSASYDGHTQDLQWMTVSAAMVAGVVVAKHSFHRLGLLNIQRDVARTESNTSTPPPAYKEFSTEPCSLRAGSQRAHYGRVVSRALRPRLGSSLHKFVVSRVDLPKRSNLDSECAGRIAAYAWFMCLMHRSIHSLVYTSNTFLFRNGKVFQKWALCRTINRSCSP